MEIVRTRLNAPTQVVDQAEQGQDDHHEHQPIHPVEQAAMTGDQVAGILHAEAALEHGLPKVAGHARQAPAEAGKRRSPGIEPEDRKGGQRHRRKHGGGKTPEKPGPGLVRREPRPKLGATDEVADDVGGDVSSPGHGEGHQDPPPPLGHGAHPDEADGGSTDVEDP